MWGWPLAWHAPRGAGYEGSRGLAATEITAFKVPGTDHAALVAHLVEA